MSSGTSGSTSSSALQGSSSAASGSISAGAARQGEDHGSFYVPSMSSTLPTRPAVRTMQSAIQSITNLIPEECRSCNADKAEAFIERVIPLMNARSHVLKAQYMHEYGSSLSGTGCTCLCGKCHLSHALPFTEMQSFLYQREEGDAPEVILTCSKDHAAQLLENGAQKIRWTAFGASHTTAHINEKCPPIISADELAARERASCAAPSFLDGTTIPTAEEVRKNGLPPITSLKPAKSSWTIGLLRDLFEKPFHFQDKICPPLSVWPEGRNRLVLYKTFTGLAKNRDKGLAQFSDQSYKNACQLYWWLNHPASALNPEHRNDGIDEAAQKLALKHHKRELSEPISWMATARLTAARVLGESLDGYHTSYEQMDVRT